MLVKVTSRCGREEQNMLVVATMVAMAGCSPIACHGPQPWRSPCGDEQKFQVPADVNTGGPSR